jgi:serine/threonine protein kinase
VAQWEGASIGPYRLIRSLGQGGTGEVYLAQGPQDSASSTGQAAVKVLGGSTSDPTAREIARQAQAAGQTHSPHITPFYGVYEQDGLLALAMAYAPGGSLGDTLAGAQGHAKPLTLPLSAGVVARLVTQLGRALAAAHAVGIAHGDLKPNNIFVRTSPSGQPLATLGDFGQALLTPAAASLVGRGAGSQMGQNRWAEEQLRFAAPEQMHGETTPATDQYGLAAIAYLLLTGETPIVGGPSLLENIAAQPVRAPSERNPELAPELDAVLLRALAKDPAQRYPTVAAFVQALDEALALPAGSGVTQQFASLSRDELAGGRTVNAQGVRLTLRPAVNGSPNASGARPAPDVPSEDAPSRLRRPLAIASAVVLLVALITCGFAFRAVQGVGVLPHISRSGSAQPTVPQSTPTEISSAKDAEATLSRLTAGKPVFKDALTSNAQHWATDGKTAFFGAGGLHVFNPSAENVAGTDAPASAITQYPDLVTSVTMSFVHSQPGDSAGMRFFINSDNGPDAEYYCYVITAEGRYEVWHHFGNNWDYLTGGYSNALNLGQGQPNTLAVLALGSSGEALLFANGHFVEKLTLPNNGATAGNVGVMVLDGGAEAVFANLAVYNAG